MVLFILVLVTVVATIRYIDSVLQNIVPQLQFTI